MEDYALKAELETIAHWMGVIEHTMTEVDLALWQWQDDIDMLVFAGMEVSLVLYHEGEEIEVQGRLHHDGEALKMSGSVSLGLAFFNDVPRDPEVVVKETKKVVRVMTKRNGEWVQVGGAEVDPKTGKLHATLTEDVPELRDIQGLVKFSKVVDPDGYEITNREAVRKQLKEL